MLFSLFFNRIIFLLHSITNRRVKLKWVLPVIFCLVLCGCNVQEVNRTDTGMGTILHIRLYGQGECGRISEEIPDQIRRMETEEISWRYETSLIGQLNAGRTVTGISKELYDALATCKTLAADSQGAFDITVGALSRLWNIDAYSGENNIEYLVPTKAQLSEAMETCGYQNLFLEDGSARLEEGGQMDLGAIGKGMALDRIRSFLEKQGNAVSGGVISLGGSILTWGCKQGNSPWEIGIVNPFDTTDYVGVLSLSGAWCVSTSGDYERYVEADGVRYHHILDPRTGYPADSGVRSVTVLSKSGLLSDALSTACFVLGIEDGMELAKRYNAEILFVDSDGKLVLSEGIKAYFRLWNSKE